MLNDENKGESCLNMQYIAVLCSHPIQWMMNMVSPFTNVSDECRHGRRAGGGGSDHRAAGPGQAAQPADGQTRGRMETGRL